MSPRGLCQLLCRAVLSQCLHSITTIPHGAPTTSLVSAARSRNSQWHSALAHSRRNRRSLLRNKSTADQLTFHRGSRKSSAAPAQARLTSLLFKSRRVVPKSGASSSLRRARSATRSDWPRAIAEQTA